MQAIDIIALFKMRRRSPQLARPVHRAAHPVHVTMRVRPGIRSLRQRNVFLCVRAAIGAANHSSFRVVQFSVQSDHLHLLVEAAETPALSRGLRGLSIRVARAVNRALGRSGPLWGDRYHARALASPREVRHGLVYVLMNFRKHLPRCPPGLDPCSSAAWFDGFRGSGPGGGGRAPLARERPPTAPPRTWLASVGWRRHGLIGVDKAPAPGTRALRRRGQPPDR